MKGGISLKKKKLFLILMGLSMLLLFSGTVYAMKSVDVVNEFATGIVDIELEEYQKNENNVEEPWKDKSDILPGQNISKIPRIQNDGNDCYVRVKITYRDTEEINDECLFGMSEDWIKADDGYYYYTKVLPHGEDVDVFQGLIIPEDFSQDNEGKSFYIDIDADAIQSKNFTPDFQAAAPWGSVEILECEKEGMYDVSTFKESDSRSFQISYEGEVKGLMRNHDDFFENFPYLMPGDKFSDSAELVNNGNHDVKIYFRSEALDDSELLDKIKLKITTRIGGVTKVIYEGPLRAEDLSETIELGIIPKGKTAYFDFEIEVPAYLNNKYTILDSYVRWIFSTKPIIKPSTDPGEPDKEPETEPPYTGPGSQYAESVRTGDDSKVGVMIILLGMSLLILTTTWYYRPKKRKEEQNETEIKEEEKKE